MTLTSRDKLQFRRRDGAIEAIRHAYSHAYHFGQSHKDLLEAKQRIYSSKEYKSLPRYMQAYVTAQDHMLLSNLYRVDMMGNAPALVFGAWIDGTFYSTHSNRPDYYGKHMKAHEFTLAAKQDETSHYWAHKTNCKF